MNSETNETGTAIVTGASGGMGVAAAARLFAAGWKQLLLCDVDESRLEAVAEPLRKQGARVTVLAGDIAAPDYAERLLASLDDKPIGALIHTAGLSPGMAEPERILEVNLDATVRLVDTVRDRMAEGAAAVLFASNSSYFPLPEEAAAPFNEPLPAGGAVSLAHLASTSAMAYPLSKQGVRALVKREAKSFGQRGARLVSLSPGLIDTPMGRAEMEHSKVTSTMIEKSALERPGRPDEIAAVAVFLCSPAASLITGCDILVDGGQVAGMGF